jgi:PEP-CTERM motif
VNKFRRLSILASALAVLAYTPSASAVINTYNFGTVLSGTGPSTNFATLTIDDVTNVFSFSPVNLSAFGSGAYIGSLAIDYTTGIGSLDATRLSGGVGAGNVDIANGGGPGGSFDFRYDLFQGQDRLTNGETLSWSSVDFDLSKLNGLALHVQGVTGGSNSSSIWYSPTPAVPEPETYVMFLAGLALVSVASRHRK